MTRVLHQTLCLATIALAISVSLPRAFAQAPVSTLLRRGADELQHGDLAAAAKDFQQALKLDPKNADAHTYLGVIADQKNEIGEAEKHFAAAVAIDPKSASARNNHGAILVKLGRKQQAIREFETSLRLKPDDPNALVNLAQLYFEHGTQPDLQRAHELFGKALKLSPDPAVARALLVTAIRVKDKDAAEADYPGYAAIVSQAPAELSGPKPRLEIGASLTELGLTSLAVEELTAALQQQPDDPQIVVALAKAYRLNDQLPQAQEILETAVSRGLKTGPIYAELAETYDAGGQVERAIPTMRQAIAAEPQNEHYHLRYGLMLNDTKAPAAAIQRLEEAVKLFPNSAAIRFALGLAYYTDHKNAAGDTRFHEALELDPNFAPAYAYRGLVLADAGKYSEAIEQYDKSLALDANVAVVHELIGEAIVRQPEPDLSRAERELRSALELDPTYANAGLELSKLLIKKGDSSGAAKELERLVALNPKLAQPHYLLGRVYAAQKRPEESKREFERFQQLDKASKDAEVAERDDLLHRLANVRY
jgi:tetratricopeptide (TPR) repeat protein